MHIYKLQEIFLDFITCFGERQMHSGGQSRFFVVVISESEVNVKSTAAMHSR